MKGMYFLLRKRNLRFMKENTRLYRMIKLFRLQMNNSNSNPSPQDHLALETIVEATTSLHGPEAAHDVSSL